MAGLNHQEVWPTRRSRNLSASHWPALPRSVKVRYDLHDLRFKFRLAFLWDKGDAMAICMHCKEEIPAFTIVCPHCDYDFLDKKTPKPEQGIEYSWAADMALMVGAIVSALGAVLLGIRGCALLAAFCFGNHQGTDELWDLVSSSLGCCLCLANLIVFVRVGNLRRD